MELDPRTKIALAADKKFRDRIKRKIAEEENKRRRFQATAPEQPILKGDDITPEARKVEEAIRKWGWFPKKKKEIDERV